MGRIVLNNGTTLQNCSVLIPPEDVEEAKQLGINRSAVCRDALKRAIQKKKSETNESE